MILRTHLLCAFFYVYVYYFQPIFILQIVSYSLEILPYGLRAKGFAIMVRWMCVHSKL